MIILIVKQKIQSEHISIYTIKLTDLVTNYSRILIIN